MRRERRTPVQGDEPEQASNGADDGIRTRDPHLGKVLNPVQVVRAVRGVPGSSATSPHSPQSALPSGVCCLTRCTTTISQSATSNAAVLPNQRARMSAGLSRSPRHVAANSARAGPRAIDKCLCLSGRQVRSRPTFPSGAASSAHQVDRTVPSRSRRCSVGPIEIPAIPTTYPSGRLDTADGVGVGEASASASARSCDRPPGHRGRVGRAKATGRT